MVDSEKDEKSDKNIFKTMDEIISQLNRTKKLFIIMILTVMVLPPIATLIVFEVLSPFEQMEQPNEHNMEKFGSRFHPLHILPLIISVTWLGIGIRQWFVLSKWTTKYDKYKKLQEDIDKKLSDDDEKKE